ncbi:MAG: Ig-like domain-containing protein, partial [Aureliella sp.]
TDPEGNPVSLSLISGAAHGTVVMKAGGAFTYTPNAGYVGVDQFVVVASDGLLSSSTTTISINVTLPFTGGGSGSSNSSSGSNSGSGSSSGSSGSSGGSTSSSGSGSATAPGTLPLAIPFTTENSSDDGDSKPAESEKVAKGEVIARGDQSPAARETQVSKASEGGVIDVYSSPSFAPQREALRTQYVMSERYVPHVLVTEPVSYLEKSERAESSEGLGSLVFVEPAKWTVISTGAVLWSVRVCQLAAALASTARAWSHFDPVVIIQQSQLNLIDDDDTDADGFTEKLFENNGKAGSRA